MTAPITLSLFEYRRPDPAPKASDGVKRAARAGSRVDASVLAVCADNIGAEMSEAEFYACVNARTQCGPDTARRRRDELQRQGFLSYERPATGVVKVEWVRP